MCRKHYRQQRSNQRKIELVERLGGLCIQCDGVFHPAAFDFHHVGEKTDNISELIADASMDAINAELEHCVLLCANCHRIEHAND